MKESVKLCILGDVCPDWGYRKTFDAFNADGIFGAVAVELRAADISICNLEAPLSKRGAPIAKTGPCLRGDPGDMTVLKAAGIDAVSLANNHILDFGSDALMDTITAAKKENVCCFGAGANEKEANKPLILTKKGYRIGFLSFAEEEFNIAYENSAGANLFDPYISLEDIADTKKQCDYLVVLYHGGIEHYKYPSPLLQKKCRAMAKAGADLVLCQHSHCIGTEETVHGGTILYGQGNAVFGKRPKAAWNEGLLVSVVLDEAGGRVSYRLLQAGEVGINFAEEDAEKKRLEELAEDSLALCNKEKLKSLWMDFCKKNESEYLPLLYGWSRVRNKLNRLSKNMLIELLIKKKSKMITMNLIRCDAHREVVQTLLENGKK